jgi:hypothetical protein
MLSARLIPSTFTLQYKQEKSQKDIYRRHIAGVNDSKPLSSAKFILEYML